MKRNNLEGFQIIPDYFKSRKLKLYSTVSTKNYRRTIMCTANYFITKNKKRLISFRYAHLCSVYNTTHFV